MAKYSETDVAVIYTNTPFIVVDNKEKKVPRFELWNTDTKTMVSKDSTPFSFDNIVHKTVHPEASTEVKESSQKRKATTKKSSTKQIEDTLW